MAKIEKFPTTKNVSNPSVLNGEIMYADFSYLAKAKLISEQLLGKTKLDIREIYNIVGGQDAKYVVAYLISENDYLGDYLKHSSAKLSKIFSSDASVTRIGEFLTLCSNLQASCSSLLATSEELLQFYKFVSKNGERNIDLENLISDEKTIKLANSTLLDAKRKGVYSNIVDKVVILPSLNCDLGLHKYISIGDIMLSQKLEVISELTGTKPNEKVLLAMLYKVTMDTMENAKMGIRFASAIEESMVEKVPKNQHRVEVFRTSDVGKLIEAIKPVSKNTIQKSDFIVATNDLTKRADLCDENIFIDTSELERNILTYIAVSNPTSINKFCNFLISNKVVLPLEKTNLYTYMPCITRYCDNKTISKAFVVKDGLSLEKSKEFNPDTFRKSHNITYQNIVK